MISLSELDRKLAENLRFGQRPGQAYFNALPNELSAKLVGAANDPYEIFSMTQLGVWIHNYTVWEGDTLIDVTPL